MTEARTESTVYNHVVKNLGLLIHTNEKAIWKGWKKKKNQRKSKPALHTCVHTKSTIFLMPPLARNWHASKKPFMHKQTSPLVRTTKELQQLWLCCMPILNTIRTRAVLTSYNLLSTPNRAEHNSLEQTGNRQNKQHLLSLYHINSNTPSCWIENKVIYR